MSGFNEKCYHPRNADCPLLTRANQITFDRGVRIADTTDHLSENFSDINKGVGKDVVYWVWSCFS